jgi:hypothetical protein
MDHFTTQVTVEELNDITEEDMIAYHKDMDQIQKEEQVAEENGLIHDVEIEAEAKWEEAAQHHQAVLEREWEELNIGYNGPQREYEYSYGREP